VNWQSAVICRNDLGDRDMAYVANKFAGNDMSIHGSELADAHILCGSARADRDLSL